MRYLSSVVPQGGTKDGCALRNLKVTMPAIASLEDLKAGQKEGVSIYAMRYALCCMEMAQDRMEKCVWSPTDKRVAAYLTPVWGDIPANIEWISLPGQAMVTGTYAGTVKRRGGRSVL